MLLLKTAQLSKAISFSAVPIVLTLIATAAEAASFNKLYVFGDSLSDVGNVSQDTGGLIPPPILYENGRFSNGPVWVEYLASSLGQTVTLDNNFAYGGATTGEANGLNPLLGGLITLPGLQQQLRTFNANNPQPEADALYILWAGANDYLNPDLTIRDATDVERVVGSTINNLTNAVSTLAQSSAKNLLVANLPDLGRLPLTRNDPTRSAGLSLLSSTHNAALARALGVLPASLGSGVNLISFDVNSLFDRAINNPGEFGLTNVTEQCLPVSPIFRDVPPPSTPCNPATTLFWDPLHPTTRGHQFIAENAFSILQAKSVPEASSVFGILAVGSFLGAGSALKRKTKRLISATRPEAAVEVE